MAAAGTWVPNGYPGNFLLPDTTQVPELEKEPCMYMQYLFN